MADEASCFLQNDSLCESLCEKGSSEEMISLNKRDEEILIDLWQEASCLWNPRDKEYKNKYVRRAAVKQIAEVMNHPEWSDGE